MKKYVLMMPLILALNGCNHVSQSELIQHSYLKNYTVGEKSTAYIGQPIVKARDYYADNKVSYNMIASTDFVITDTYQKKIFDYSVKVAGKKGVSYPSSGSIKIDNIEYNVINFKNEASNKKEEIGILIDNKGQIYRNVVTDDDHDVVMKLIPSDKPQDAEMITFTKGSANVLTNEKDIDLFACKTNYELIYGGINNVSISMTYREFTIDDMARPSFFQNIIYETGAKQIRFKDTLLDVIEVTNEKIVYKVLSDGLVESTFDKDNTPKDYKDCKYSYERMRKLKER